MSWEPSKGNEDRNNWSNLSLFMLGLMKGGQSCRNVLGQGWAKCDELGGTSWGLCVCAQHPPVLEIRVFLPSRYREGTFHARVLLPACGAGGRRLGKVRKPSCFSHFLLQLKRLNTPRCHILGWCVLNPITCTFRDGRPILNASDGKGQKQLGAITVSTDNCI